MGIAVTVHLFGVIIWVGGMFFAHMVLRGAINEALEPEQRLPLMLKVFDGFFPWVWLSAILILASGYWMLFSVYQTEIPHWLGFMSVAGTLMAAIFVFIYAVPYRQFSNAIKSKDRGRAVASITLIRRLILINLLLGLLITLVTLLGRHGLI